MKRFALPLIAASLTATSLSAQVAGGYVPRTPRYIDNGAQWMTTADGCSYSRTQAPGQPVQWILIRNPHHIGGRAAHRGCRSLIQG